MDPKERTPGAFGVVWRSFVAALVMGLALAVASWASALFGVAAGPDHPVLVRLGIGGAVTVVVVTVVVLLCRVRDRAPLSSIGLTGTRADLRGFLLGAGIVTAAGVVMIGVVTVFGLASWSGFDPSSLVLFLVTNAIVALLLEAVPEEVSIRGYALTAVRGHFPTSTATALNIATFLVVPVIALGAHVLLDRSLGDPSSVFALAPGGQDPVMYYLMLAVFGLLLIHARDSTVSATVWTCVGAHVAWLTVNRIVLGQASGAGVELGEVGTLVFFATYVSAVIIAFSTLASRTATATAAAAETERVAT